MINNKILNSPIDFFDDLDQDTKNAIELESILVDIASMIINYRIDNKLSQKELAEKLEISQAMVSKIESGDYNPSIEFLFKISKKLNLNLVIELNKSETYDVEYTCNSLVNDIYQLDLISAA